MDSIKEKEAMARAKAYAEGAISYGELHPMDLQYIRKFGPITRKLNVINTYVFAVLLDGASIDDIENKTIIEVYDDYHQNRKKR